MELFANKCFMINDSKLKAFVVFPGLAEKAISGECISETQCPHPCRCADGIVDCREKALSKVPDHLPEGTTELLVVLY